MNDAHFFDTLIETTPPTRNVVYKTSGNRSLHLHVFEPKGHKSTDKRPCLFMVHGGGWVEGAPEAVYPYLAHFARLGIPGFSLQYRLVTENSGSTIFDCVKDGRSAMRYLRRHAAEFGIDPQRIVAGGGSAGAHVAVGTTLFSDIDEAGEDITVSCAAQALMLLYPVIDTSAEGYGCNRIGSHWRDISPLHQVRPGLPPTILFHGTADSTTPFSGAQRFHQAMTAAENSCELHPWPGGQHAHVRMIRAAYEDAIGKMETFLARNGFRP